MAARHPVVDLGDALAAEITQSQARLLGRDLVDQLRELAERVGGARAAARLLGEPKTSVNAWINSTRRPSRKAVERLAGKVPAALRRALLPPDRERRLRRGTITITGTDRYDDRYRTITPKGPRIGDAIVDAYLRGDDVREAYASAIVDPMSFYPDYIRSDAPDFGIDVERIDWR